MKNTINAKIGYTVKNNYHDIWTGEKVRVLFDGDDLLFVGHIMTLEDHKDEMLNNEMYHVVEIFTTVKGNQFIYSRDEEADIDYLIKL